VSIEQTNYSEQADASPGPQGHEAPVGFFVIGIVVNVVLITAYFIWAYKQGKKPRSRDKS
jgi:heme/copper-type cytochrome/quinol oxidase subunit 2